METHCVLVTLCYTMLYSASSDCCSFHNTQPSILLLLKLQLENQSIHPYQYVNNAKWKLWSSSSHSLECTFISECTLKSTLRNILDLGGNTQWTKHICKQCHHETRALVLYVRPKAWCGGGNHRNPSMSKRSGILSCSVNSTLVRDHLLMKKYPFYFKFST